MSRPRSALEAQQLFKKRFGYQAAHTVIAPAHVELLGADSEFNEGLSLTAAVNQYIQVAASPRFDGRIELACSASATRDLFWLSEIAPHPLTPWATPFKSVLLALRRKGVPFSGFNAAFHLGIQPGAGLSETAALQTAAALTVRKLYPYKLTESGCMSRPPQRDKRGRLPPLSKGEKLALARACHSAKAPERPPGLLDRLSSLSGKAFHALCVDCRFDTVEALPMIGELVLVLCPCGITDVSAAEAIMRRRRLCQSAAEVLSARSLRSVDAARLSALRMELSGDEYGCAYHVIGEIQRVVFAERALREGDFAQLGQYLLQSHESARDFFQSSCPELDLLVDLAREHPGCLGARLSGSGFGGATLNLVSWNQYEDFIKHVARRYEHHTGRRIRPFVCQVVDGAD